MDQANKDIVFGYLRNIQMLIPSDSVYYTIPTLVWHWCLLYFHHKEFLQYYSRFGQKQPDHLFINKTRNIVKVLAGSADFELKVFGNICIDEMDNKTYIWTIKILNVHENYPFGVGLSWKDASLGKFYCCYMETGELQYSSNFTARVRSIGAATPQINDHIKMRYHGSNKELTFYINDRYRVCQKLSFEDPCNAIKYSLTLWVSSAGMELELTDFVTIG